MIFKELNEKLEASELQNGTLSSEYRLQLTEKQVVLCLLIKKHMHCIQIILCYLRFMAHLLPYKILMVAEKLRI